MPDFGFLHKFYAHTKYAIFTKQQFSMKNTNYDLNYDTNYAPIQEFFFHKCIIIAYF